MNSWDVDKLLSMRILGKRVLLHREPVPERSAGGIYILGREYPAIAQVIAVGSKVGDFEISVGMWVTFNRYEFEKWQVIPEYAIMPIDRLELRIREL